jgi:hypothetical protein
VGEERLMLPNHELEAYRIRHFVGEPPKYDLRESALLRDISRGR